MNIVGAGAAGLSLALMLDEPCMIFEKDATPGGLCRSTTLDGFTFDTGPHILGGIPDAVDWIIESTGVTFTNGTTKNRGWVDGEYVHHPFDDDRLGAAYMAKMWKADPVELSLAGLGAQSGRRPGGVTTFRYPASGGYQAITDAWARRLDGAIMYGVTINPSFPDVISTAPVPDARYNSLAVVTLGFEGTPPDLTAIYLPEPWTLFHRLSIPSNFAASNAPPGCWSLQGEISYPPGADHRGDLCGELEMVAERLGLRGRLVMRHTKIVLYAYPVPIGPPPAVVGHGRTGGHQYLNLDGVVAASSRLACSLV